MTPAGGPVAAWGDPAIVLTCGVSTELPLAVVCQEVAGVDWYAPESSFDQSAPAVLTTVGRSPQVRLEVPADYRPPTEVLVGVASAIVETLARDPVQPCG